MLQFVWLLFASTEFSLTKNVAKDYVENICQCPIAFEANNNKTQVNQNNCILRQEVSNNAIIYLSLYIRNNHHQARMFCSKEDMKLKRQYSNKYIFFEKKGSTLKPHSKIHKSLENSDLFLSFCNQSPFRFTSLRAASLIQRSQSCK